MRGNKILLTDSKSWHTLQQFVLFILSDRQKEITESTTGPHNS